jgi:ATP-dependent DNA helicase RecG
VSQLIPDTDLIALLEELRALPSETEWLEFKSASTDFSFDKLGQYFSALSNEANLKGRSCGWLIFGIDDKSHQIIGTSYRRNIGGLESLKHEITEHLSPALSFIEIYDLNLPAGRVLMLQIPAAPRGMPVAWKKHFYGRDGESITGLNLSELEQIRNQVPYSDWSSVLLPHASWDDLSVEAISYAREKYADKHPELAQELATWDDHKFLHKLKVAVDNQLTRAAILLLGKPESSHLIPNTDLRLSWILQDAHGTPKDYYHFGLPLLLSASKVAVQIRNLTYRYIANESLFPTEIPQYDNWVLREALHNCIAHQDYALSGKVNIIEKPEELIFSNLGAFIPKSIASVIEADVPPERYRNPLLAQAMVELKMIDTIGSGIKRMFTHQRQRFFPLPEYTIDAVAQRVEVRIYGRLLSEAYSHVLQQMPELGLYEVMLLDSVQKAKPITHDGLKRLRQLKLVEGRYPNLHVSAGVANALNDKASYIRNRGLDKQFYERMVLEHLKQFGSATREELNEVLLSKLPDVLDETQKITRIKNLISGLSGTKIINTGSRTKPCWKLKDA